MIKALDIVIFTIPILFLLKPIFKKKRNLRTVVIERFEKNKELGLKGTMKEGTWYFFITALLAAYAYLRAGFPYLWLAVSVVFALMGLIMLSVLLFQHFTKQETPEFPDTITEDAINRGVEKEKKERIRRRFIRFSVLTIWIYSWRTLINE